MTTLIIEDEKLAAERLHILLQQCVPDITVLKTIDTVEETTAWLCSNHCPDFILLDIHLADGSAFDIFRQVRVETPVIFTTAYDQYAMEAFKVLSIDYLLKPVTAEALQSAIQKLRLLRPPATLQSNNYIQLLQLLQQQGIQQYKKRFVGKVGQKLFFIDAADVAYFVADKKMVTLHTTDGHHYLIDYTLEDLEKTLDPAQFFRINRSIIVKARAIDQVRPYINSRLKIVFKAGQQTEEAIVSRERVNDFKNWANN
jgi:two-component system, LytTR family, response regulator LytT